MQRPVNRLHERIIETLLESITPTAQPKPKLVLASASARRLDLLAQIGVTPDIVDPAELDETPHNREAPRPYAKRIAAEKARAVAARHAGAMVLSADTAVACAQRILPKAETMRVAEDCLRCLSGRRHRVLSVVCLILPDGSIRQRVVETAIRFKRLEAQEIAAYIKGGEWHGKAGGYAIQGQAAVFVAWLNGSYSNVVGLPLFETHALLKSAGLAGNWQPQKGPLILGDVIR